MKRLRDKITTLIALLIFVPTVILVFVGKATLTEASGFLVIATALFFSKDKQFMDNFTKK